MTEVQKKNEVTTSVKSIFRRFEASFLYYEHHFCKIWTEGNAETSLQSCFKSMAEFFEKKVNSSSSSLIQQKAQW